MFDLKEFTVDRKTWLRGEGSGKSKLLRGQDGKMCCLGFAALACGHTREDIYDESQPDSLSVKIKFPETIVFEKEDSYLDENGSEVVHTNLYHSATCGELMDINDEEDIDDDLRESQLTEKFASIGIKVNFEG